jgi:hypothetical protein
MCLQQTDRRWNDYDKTHVDDLKVSIRTKEQIQEVIDQLKAIYNKVTVHEEEIHDYLGMIVEHDCEAGSVKINMRAYIEGTVIALHEDEPDEKLKEVSTPATNNLFKIQEGEVEKLLHKRAKTFHSIVARLLFAAKRSRPDILLAVSFLTTHVKEPDADDWKKLIRVLSYLQGTLDHCLMLVCTNLDQLTWYIDGSYASHMDMKGQSGAVLVPGNFAVLFKSSKQKVNTRSSTETELIAVDDALSTIQWTKNFMKEQGYELNTENKEDIRSTMLLMKNGKLSSGKWTRHLDVKILLRQRSHRSRHCKIVTFLDGAYDSRFLY